MRKKVLSILSALLFTSSPFLAVLADEPLQAPIPVYPIQKSQKQILGKEAIAAIRSAYEKGEYTPFFEKIDHCYRSALQEGQLTELIAFRRGPLQTAEAVGAGPIEQLRKERNQALLQLLEGQKTSLLSEKIRSVASEVSPAEQEKALLYLAPFQYMAPGTGRNADENRLIELDLEYEYKAIHLDLPQRDGKPLADRREKHYALKMEKMAKMREISKEFQDPSLKEAVAQASATLDARLAQNWDLTDLGALARGKSKPSSSLEEKLISILNGYQEKFAELVKSTVEGLS